MPVDTKNVGQDKTYKDVTEEYDSAMGKYKDAVDALPIDRKLPLAQIPMAPAPSPFKLGSV